MCLPTMVTLMLRFHVLLPPPVGLTTNSHLNIPSWAAVTVKIFRLKLLGIPLKLKFEVKAASTANSPAAGTMVAAVAPSNFKVTVTNVSSMRLKFHLSGSLLDPLRSCMLCVRSSAGSVTAPTGGGSYQETLSMASKNKEQSPQSTQKTLDLHLLKTLSFDPFLYISALSYQKASDRMLWCKTAYM